MTFIISKCQVLDKEQSLDIFKSFSDSVRTQIPNHPHRVSTLPTSYLSDLFISNTSLFTNLHFLGFWDGNTWDGWKSINGPFNCEEESIGASLATGASGISTKSGTAEVRLKTGTSAWLNTGASGILLKSGNVKWPGDGTDLKCKIEINNNKLI